VSQAIDDGGFRQLIDKAGGLGAVRISTVPKPTRDSISPEFKAYLNERRRALITELTALDKLLGRETIK